MSIEHTIRDFIAREIMHERAGAALDLDYPLIEEKVLDSMDVQRLVAFVEERFGVRVTDDHLLPDNFASVRAMASLVVSLQRSA